MTTIAAEATKQEPLDPKVRKEIVSVIARALESARPDIRFVGAGRLADDMASDTLDSFLIELEGRR